MSVSAMVVAGVLWLVAVVAILRSLVLSINGEDLSVAAIVIAGALWLIAVVALLRLLSINGEDDE